MKARSSPTSRAKASSWFTTIIVMPDAARVAHHGEHLADQLGGRAPRSARRTSISSGSIASARRDGDALLLAAGELGGVAARLTPEADALQKLHATLTRLTGRHALHADGRFDDVPQRGHVREQIELLEHHADPAAHAGDVPFRQLVEPATPLAVADELARHPEPAGIDPL